MYFSLWIIRDPDDAPHAEYVGRFPTTAAARLRIASTLAFAGHGSMILGKAFYTPKAEL